MAGFVEICANAGRMAHWTTQVAHCVHGRGWYGPLHSLCPWLSRYVLPGQVVIPTRMGPGAEIAHGPCTMFEPFLHTVTHVGHFHFPQRSLKWQLSTVLMRTRSSKLQAS